MKIKSLLIGMLACTALVGCSDDDIIQGGNEQQESTKLDAFITISIDPSTSSSRSGNNADGYGDSDPNADDNGHHNGGTVAENKVNDVLVIITGEEDGIVEKLDANKFSKSGDLYTLTKKYRMTATGDYKVMAVINPVAGLLDDTFNGYITSNSHADAYDAVCNYKYTGSIDNFKKDGFMMSNRTEVPVKLDESHNSPDNAYVAEVEVERAISKITFRPKAGETGLDNNVYPVEIDEMVYDPVTSDGWWLNGNDWEYATFNSANQGQYWVLVTGNAGSTEDYILDSGQLDPTKVRGVFTKQTGENNTHTGIVTDDVTDNTAGTTTAVIMNKQTFTVEQIEALILDREGEGEDVTPKRKYYVQLQNYALVNLTKSLYGVRHIAPNNYVEDDVVAMGKLNIENIYLVDPYSIEKNNWQKTEETLSDNWFDANSTWKKVVADAETLRTSKGTTLGVFKPLPGLVTNSGDLGEGENDNQTVDTTHGTEGVGQLLSYCFENAVIANMQLRGLVTGIVFSGQIFTDAECTNKVAVMYKYKGEYFETLSALLDKYQIEDDKLTDLTAYSSDDVVEATDVIDVYRDGQCFYYSAQIEHLDNDTEGSAPSLGVMEYAIMRNNIYSLSISGLSNIGSATVNPEPGAAVEDEGAYITMQAKILPWIVRFNDIDF